jgi:hypothetical protein
MTDRQDWWQPQNSQRGYGQQQWQEPSWQPQQYDPRAHQQRMQSVRQEAPWDRYGQVPEQQEQPPVGSAPPRGRRSGAPQRTARSISPVYAVVALAVGIVIGGPAGYALHGSAPANAAAGGAAASSPAAAPSAAAVPDSAAAAKSAAASFLALYSAGQWAPAWQYLTAADKAKAPLNVYETVHAGCPSKAAGLAYAIKSATMAGKTAVITYSLSGAVGALGSATLAETWTPAGWTVAPDDMSVYSHGSASADLAAAKASGDCAS